MRFRRRRFSAAQVWSYTSTDHPGVFPQVALHRVQLAAMVYRDARGQGVRSVVLVGFVGHDLHALDAFGRDLAHHLRHGEGSVHRLPARHRHRIVEQDLVGDRHVRRDRLPDGQQPGMRIRPVAQIGEHVLRLGERRLADPGHALPAHLREQLRLVRPQPNGHVVAADAGERAASLRQFRRRVVRAPGAEMRYAQDAAVPLLEQLLLVGEEVEPLLDAFARVEARDAFRDHPGDDGGAQLAGRGQLPVVRRQLPLALLVVFADHARADVFPPIVSNTYSAHSFSYVLLFCFFDSSIILSA